MNRVDGKKLLCPSPCKEAKGVRCWGLTYYILRDTSHKRLLQCK